MTPSFSVIVPTFERPDLLLRCLEGLAEQSDPPEEVLVVVRRSDLQSVAVARNHPMNPHVVEVDQPGVLAAMAAGLKASTSRWVAFTDDDAKASPTWIAQLRVAANEKNVVGVGGRDMLYDDGLPRPTTLTQEVGRIGPMGQLIGHHHRGTGPARAVEVLKGVNCAYDATYLGIPEGLVGTGAQAHFEVAIGLDLAKVGTLIYDPSIIVRHEPGDRSDDDRRHLPSKHAIADVATNAVLACTARSRFLAIRRVVFATIVGDRSCPGLIRCLVALGDGEIRRRLLPSLYGTLRGFFLIVAGRRVHFLRR